MVPIPNTVHCPWGTISHDAATTQECSPLMAVTKPIKYANIMNVSSAPFPWYRFRSNVTCFQIVIRKEYEITAMEIPSKNFSSENKWVIIFQMWSWNPTRARSKRMSNHFTFLCSWWLEFRNVPSSCLSHSWLRCVAAPSLCPPDVRRDSSWWKWRMRVFSYFDMFTWW